MSAVEIVALAASFSLLSGWRLYFSLLAAGLAMRFNLIALPDQLAALDVLANPWVLGLTAMGFVAEFFADKIAWLDSAWDGLHSILLGGGAALLSHGVKSGTRVVVNASPEPFSNAVVSAGEDVATIGVAALALSNPLIAAVIAVTMLLASIVALLALRRIIRRIGANLQKGPGHMLGVENAKCNQP